MSCRDALIPNPITINSKSTVEDALIAISQNSIRAIPVIDDTNTFIGLFGLHSLMDDLLPMAARMEGGVEDLGFVVDGAPGAAKRIRKIAPRPVGDYVEKGEEDTLLNLEITMLEVIRRLSKYGSPLPVIDENHKFMGLVSEQSCLNHLKNVLTIVEEQEKN